MQSLPCWRPKAIWVTHCIIFHMTHPMTHCSPPPGDHLYRMDYREFVMAHRKANADFTVAALPCAEAEASAFGLMKIDDAGRCVHVSRGGVSQQVDEIMKLNDAHSAPCAFSTLPATP